MFESDDPELSPEGCEEVRGRLLHAGMLGVSTLFKILCSFLNYDAGIAGVHFTGPRPFSFTEPTPASASAPAIAGLCPSPQNGQLASTIPIHIGPNLISEVHRPSGSTSQQLTSCPPQTTGMPRSTPISGESESTPPSKRPLITVYVPSISDSQMFS